MTLEDTLLQSLAEWRPTPGERQTLNLTHQDSGWTVALTAERCDDLGILLWELSLRRITPALVGLTLTTWANRVAQNAKGLLETLTVHEVDLLRNEALVRSTEPTQRKQAVAYYEVLLRGTDTAMVRRFQNSSSLGKREQVPFVLTHEVLARLVWDLSA